MQWINTSIDIEGVDGGSGLGGRGAATITTARTVNVTAAVGVVERGLALKLSPSLTPTNPPKLGSLGGG